MPSRTPVRSNNVPNVVLDANVLVPNALRDTLLRIAEAGLYEVRWSASTLVEVERALLNRILVDHPERADRVQRLLAALRIAFPAATVRESQALLDRLTNDPKDRHVLAAAIQSRATVIVTNNLRDFPSEALGPYGIVASSPDEFLQQIFARSPGKMLDLLTAQGAALKQPRTLDAILDTLSQHAPEFARLASAYLGEEQE